MEMIGEPGFYGHLLDQDAGSLELFRGEVHLESKQV
jgi:hypothetical protein